MTDTDTDRTTFAPFILMDGEYRSLFLSDRDMAAKFALFEERAGWQGNGYDWNSVAQVVVAEQLPDLAGQLSFDPSAGMFSASGSRAALERLGEAMRTVFHDDAALREVLGRAELD